MKQYGKNAIVKLMTFTQWKLQKNDVAITTYRQISMKNTP